MRKRLFLSLIILLGLSFLIIYLVRNFGTLNIKEKLNIKLQIKNILEICNNVQEEQKDSCYWNFAKSEQDFLICDKIQKEWVKNFCYLDIAEERQDLSICDRINDKTKKYYCYLKIAETKKDLSICDKIQYEENENYYENNEYFKNNCYLKVAQAKQDLYICDKINDSFVKDDCYKLLAVIKQDLSICDKLYYSNKKDYCYSRIAQVKQDSSICDKIVCNEVSVWDWCFKDFCYQSIAQAKQNISFCENIKNYLYGKSYCYQVVGEITQNLSICNKIEDKLKKGWCYRSIAVLQQNPSICEKIDDEDIKDYCYWDIALNTQNQYICEKLQNEKNKDYCYLNVSETKKETRLSENSTITNNSSVNKFIEIRLGDLKEGKNIIGGLTIERKFITTLRDGFMFIINNLQYIINSTGLSCGAYQCGESLELNIVKNGSNNQSRVLDLWISDYGGEIYFFKYMDFLYLIERTVSKPRGLCYPIERNTIYSVYKDILESKLSLRHIPLLMRKNGKLYLKAEKNFCYEDFCDSVLENLEYIKKKEEDFYTPQNPRYRCFCYDFNETAPCVDEYFLIDNGKFIKSNQDFKSKYLEKAEKYEEELQKKNWQNDNWLLPLLNKTLNLIFAGEEEKAWREFFEDFQNFSQVYPLEGLEKINPNKIKAELQKIIIEESIFER
ncbi:MAG: hypothetical protein KatS3mg096_516 [Candidatus Parcubacteria bacterium]|nr:MAG: hypothetical protein KatS3mg093_434 [Candidatus Parcubacteria bacterium]GIW67648.1 MAG: hypothetical protein KatS3mg096_516 [Candidatus Parcubacteria bacterium]